MSGEHGSDAEWWLLWWPFLMLFVGGWIFLATRHPPAAGGTPTLLSPTSGLAVAVIIWLGGFTPVLYRFGGRSE